MIWSHICSILLLVSFETYFIWWLLVIKVNIFHCCLTFVIHKFKNEFIIDHMAHYDFFLEKSWFFCFINSYLLNTMAYNGFSMKLSVLRGLEGESVLTDKTVLWISFVFYLQSFNCKPKHQNQSLSRKFFCLLFVHFRYILMKV